MGWGGVCLLPGALGSKSDANASLGGHRLENRCGRRNRSRHDETYGGGETSDTRQKRWRVYGNREEMIIGMGRVILDGMGCVCESRPPPQWTSSRDASGPCARHSSERGRGGSQGPRGVTQRRRAAACPCQRCGVSRRPLDVKVEKMKPLGEIEGRIGCGIHGHMGGESVCV